MPRRYCAPAIILLLAHLGLRAAEVLRLHLEDVEWRQAKLRVRAGKDHRERILPLATPERACR
jgi:integrase